MGFKLPVVNLDLSTVEVTRAPADYWTPKPKHAVMECSRCDTQMTAEKEMVLLKWGMSWEYICPEHGSHYIMEGPRSMGAQVSR